MGEFHFIDHTAEVGVAATGASLKEVLALLAQGMFAVMADLDTVEERQAIDVEVTSPSLEELLVEWLNELIYRAEVEGVLLKRFDIHETSETHVRARCYGEPLDPRRHTLRSGVKAATYHMAQLKRNGEYYAQVILDV